MTHEVLPLNNVVEEEEQRNGQLEDTHCDSNSEQDAFIMPLSAVHSIILDWTSASFIDSVGAKAIKQVLPCPSGVVMFTGRLVQHVKGGQTVDVNNLRVGFFELQECRC